MKNNVIKWFLTLSVATLALATNYGLSHLEPGLYAATYAFIAASVLFVRLLPGEGIGDRWANFVIGYTGAVTTSLAAWYWLQGEGGLQSPLHAWIVLAVLLIITLVVLITAYRALSSLNTRERED